jgi:25S rRNA (uracil2634-N3)-methyltransferase
MGKTGKTGKGSLKSALQAQQSRLEKKQKALQAAQVAEQKYAKKKANGKSSSNSNHTSPHTTQQTIPFRPTDKVLLVGEGNFSFTRALVRLYQNEAAGGSGCTIFMPPANITATAYDSDEVCYAKYPGSKEIVEEVRKTGVQVFFNVDATRLDKATPLKGKRFDKVIWNFPHAGEFKSFEKALDLIYSLCRERYHRSRSEHSLKSVARSFIFAISCRRTR